MNSLDDRRKAPVRQQARDIPCPPPDPRLGIDVILKDDLSCRMRETHQRRSSPSGRDRSGPAAAEIPEGWRALPVTRIAVARARTRSRTAQIGNIKHEGRQAAGGLPCRHEGASLPSTEPMILQDPAENGHKDTA